MKSPTDLAEKLRRRWNVARHREELLLPSGVWPVTLPIGKPTPDAFTYETAKVRAHVERWRAISIGTVNWQPIKFRSGSDPIDVPLMWQLDTTAQWVAATGDRAIEQQYSRLTQLLTQLDARFHRVVIRQPHLLEGRTDSEILQVASAAIDITPGCAAGRPLRAVQAAGADTKFLERNRPLLVALLDALYSGEASELGLAKFLNALEEEGHWLLVVPLDRTLLPFAQQRVRAGELATTSLPGTHLLVVENERSLYQLPPLPNTVAVLGAGLNLEWMSAPWLRIRHVAYWGDLDTWGLQMLATARQHAPGLTPLLMTQEVFEAHAETSAVSEPRPAEEAPPAALLGEERRLYTTLRASSRGRLEQEFLPRGIVEEAVRSWHSRE